LIGKLCPCGCNRLEPCPRGAAIQVERQARAAAGAGKRWDAHHDRHPEWSALYRSPRWREARAAQLAMMPWCLCGRKATDVDHKEPHRGEAAMFYDPENLRSMCKACHMAKTRQDRER
jgi:5-methylcytosine-specific restriction endonuclease McrA